MGFGCNVPDKCWDREGRRLAALLLLCSQILLCLSLGAVMRWEEKQHETASRLNYACLHLLTEDKSVRPLQCHHTHTNTHTLMHTHTSIHAKLTLLMQFIGLLGPYQTISLSCSWVWFYSYGTQNRSEEAVSGRKCFSRMGQTWGIDPGDSGLCPICNQCALFSFFPQFSVTVLATVL